MDDNLKSFGLAEEQLDVVNEAIYAVLKGGQSYRIGTRQLTRADLKLLYNMQLKLQAQVADDRSSGLFADTAVAIFDGR